MNKKREFIYATFIAVLVLCISNISIIVPSVIKKDSLIFLGRRAINSEDVYTYVSTIEQVRQGRTLVENQYTSEPQAPSLFRPSYILIGNVARIMNISSMNAYQLFRVIFSVIFYVILYQFLSLYFDAPKKRLLAFIIALTASGLGFLFVNWLPGSIDLWIPEAFSFLSFAEAPHFMLSFTLLLTGFYFFIKYLKKENVLLLLPMFLSFLLLSFEHPFDIIFVVPVLFITALWNKTPFIKSLVIACIGGIGVLYQIFETYNNPIIKAWQSQNLLLSPSPASYLAGFGLLIIFGLFGLQIFTNEQKIEQKLVISWIVVTAFLLYAPINFQRRFVEGVEIPLAIASATGIFYIIDRYKSKVKDSVFEKDKLKIAYTSGLLLTVIIIVLSLSSFYVIYRDFKTYTTDSKDLPYYYIKPENLEGIQWLSRNSTFKDTVLCNVYFGNIIPGIIGRKVFLGHYIQTIDLNNKIQTANSFLLEKDNKKAVDFLKDNHITHIFLGVNDSMATYGFKPDEKNYLTKEYDKDGVRIYFVNN